MNAIREQILRNGVVPILSIEGSICLFEEYLKSITERKVYETRKIELSRYKNPKDTANNTPEQWNEYTLKIVMLLINKMKNMAITNGYEAVYNNLPNNYKKFSYDEFLTMLSMSEENINNCINNYNGISTESFINMLISTSKINDDRIGKTVVIPYGNDNPHKKDADYRIYINTPNGINRYEFLKLYIEKCVDRNIPFEMKGEEHTGDEKDRTCLYCFDEYFDETIKILEEIKTENPELVSAMGSPIATGLNCSYYAITTSRQGATYNYWFNRVSSHAINYLCANLIKSDIDYFSELSDEEKSQIESISNIHSHYYSFDSEGRFSGASNYIINDYIIKNKETIMQEETLLKLMESLKLMCSLANFQDLEHSNFPISLDSEFYKQPELSVKTATEEKVDDSVERELYLYHTEDFINKVLELYQQGDVGFGQLMDNYLKRMDSVYKKYRYYATREPGFITSERNKEVATLFKRLYTGYEKPESDSRIERLEYYQNIQNGVNSYLNERIEENTPQDISNSSERRGKVK